jgi:hypothetical protein
MKIDFEKIFFYFMLILVSGSIGYALKPSENMDQKRLQENYLAQQKACTQAMHRMNSFTKQNYYKPQSKKQVAIERMMSN